MKKKGFTYIEVMIAFAIFALIFTYVMKLNKSSNAVMRDERQRLQMIYIAQMQLEKYKSQISNSDFIYYDSNNVSYYVSVSFSKADNISSTSIKEIKVTVKKKKNDSLDKEVVLKSHVFVD